MSDPNVELVRDLIQAIQKAHESKDELWTTTEDLIHTLLRALFQHCEMLRVHYELMRVGREKR